MALPLSLMDIIEVNVSVAEGAVAPFAFNQGLMIGTSSVIPSYGPDSRIREYSTTDEMLVDGFTDSDPEYLAATLYASQPSNPGAFWIGRQDLTAIQTAVPDGRTVTDGAMSSSVNPTYLDSATAAFVSGDIGSTVRVVGAGSGGADLVTTIASINSGTEAVLTDAASTTVSGAQVSIGPVGSGYAVNDLVYPSSGGTNAILKVSSVGQSGVVTGLSTIVGSQGTGFSIESGLDTTTNGSGTGLEINVTAIGETPLQAVQACQLLNQNQQWYGVMVCGATDADHLAIGAYVTANWEQIAYFGATVTTDVVNGVPNNVALQAKALQYKIFLIYSTTQSGLYPNNIYAAAAVLGEYAGLNTGLSGSAFTMALKDIVGIAEELITQTQYNNLLEANCNAILQFGPYTNQLYNGILSSGDYFDQILFRAMLVNRIQIDLMNLLTTVQKVPQTNAGEQALIGQVDNACQSMVDIGYLAPGVWNGPAILNGLVPGQTLPLGYLNQAQPYSAQNPGDRAARKAMPIYCAIIEAGAVHSVQVNVNVQI
jgi:hypothetical protein